MPDPVASISAFGASAFDAAARHMATTFATLLPRPPLVERPGLILGITGEPHPLGNFAILTDPEDAFSAREAIAELVACPAPSAFIAVSETTPEIGGLLAEAGFEGHGGMPAMAVDIEAVGATSLPEGYSFARVGAGEDGDAWARALGEAYGLPAALAEMFAPRRLGLGDGPEDATQCFAVVRNGRVVATSMLHLADGLAGIYCVATRPEERGRGLGAHATAEPLRIAAGLGYRVGILQSSTDGYPVYRRLGFQDLGGMPFYVRMPS